MPRSIHIFKVFHREPDVERVQSLAGRNNLLPRLPEKYLCLRSFGTTVRDGKWHTDLYFTPLRSLSELENPVDAVNWRAWIGEGWEVRE